MPIVPQVMSVMSGIVLTLLLMQMTPVGERALLVVQLAALVIATVASSLTRAKDR